MKIVLICFFLTFGLFACNPTEPDTTIREKTTLEECETYEDLVYVIDNYSYSKSGNLKPPCSVSPDYCGCMKSRGINGLGCE